MCGILGVVKIIGNVEESQLYKGLDKIEHRGPDNRGIWINNVKNIGLGHQRLSIIDLDKRSDQPYHKNDLKLHIVFNGEIYNFKEIREELRKLGYGFETQSDTEVLLCCYDKWGEGMFSKIKGMFSFCIYDEKKDVLFCARDRAGEKPFFYYHENGVFAFASEIKAILETGIIKKDINYVALDYLLAYGYTPQDVTIFKHISKLQAGNYLKYEIKNNNVTIKRYWELPQKITPNHITKEEEYINELEELLNKAVKEQLVSDVPVGVLLSGGLDSSLVTAIAAGNKEKIDTYNVSYPQNNDYDESKHALKIAKYFSTNHHQLNIEDVNFDILKKLAKQYDDLIFDSSMIPTFLISKLVKSNCTVALGGDGGDELFAGYNHYTSISQLGKRIRILPRNASTLINFLIRIKYVEKHPKRFWIENLYNESRHIPFAPGYFKKKERDLLIPHLKDIKERAESLLYSNIIESINYTETATRQDFHNYLPGDILVKVDRASMLNSLEIRAPFLDYRIIEFAFEKLPTKFKSDGIDKKIILKKLAQKLLPSDFDLKRKQGFGIPVGEWLTNGKWAKEYNEITARIDDKNAKNFFINEKNGTKRFALTLLYLWTNEYGIKIF